MWQRVAADLPVTSTNRSTIWKSRPKTECDSTFLPGFSHLQQLQQNAKDDSILLKKQGIANFTNNDELDEFLLSLQDTEGGFGTNFESFIPEEDLRDGKWLKTSESCYGVVIGHALNFMVIDLKVLLRGFLFCFQQLIVIGVTQGFILYQLWVSLPSIREGPFCKNSYSFFYICIMTVFVVSLVPSLLEVCDELKIALCAEYLFRYTHDGYAVVEKLIASRAGRCVATTIVLYEFAVWLGVLVTGSVLILTTEGIGDIVGATVAITFVCQLGHMSLFMYGREDKLATDGRYRTRSGGRGSDFTVHLMLPTLVTASAVAILQFCRYSYC